MTPAALAGRGKVYGRRRRRVCVCERPGPVTAARAPPPPTSYHSGGPVLRRWGCKLIGLFPTRLARREGLTRSLASL